MQKTIATCIPTELEEDIIKFMEEEGLDSIPPPKTPLQAKTLKKQAKEAINRMVSAGWRLTAEEYAKLTKELE